MSKISSPIKTIETNRKSDKEITNKSMIKNEFLENIKVISQEMRETIKTSNKINS